MMVTVTVFVFVKILCGELNYYCLEIAFGYMYVVVYCRI